MKNGMISTELDGKTQYFKIGLMYEKAFIEYEGTMWIESQGTVPGLTATTGNFIHGTEKHESVYGTIWETLGQSMAPGMGECRVPPVPSPADVHAYFAGRS